MCVLFVLLLVKLVNIGQVRGHGFYKSPNCFTCHSVMWFTNTKAGLHLEGEKKGYNEKKRSARRVKNREKNTLNKDSKIHSVHILFHICVKVYRFYLISFFKSFCSQVILAWTPTFSNSKHSKLLAIHYIS